MDVDGEQPAAQRQQQAQQRQQQQQHRPAATTLQLQRPPRPPPPQPQHQMRASQQLSLADVRAREAQSLERLMRQQPVVAAVAPRRVAPPSRAPLTAATSGGGEPTSLLDQTDNPREHSAAALAFGAAVALAEARVPGYSLATTMHSPLFVPFLCAVLGVKNRDIGLVELAVRRALGPSAWTDFVATYAAEFAVRGVTQHTVEWDPGRGPDDRDPCMGSSHQRSLMEPREVAQAPAPVHDDDAAQVHIVSDDEVRDGEATVAAVAVHVTDEVYMRFMMVSPVFFMTYHGHDTC